MLHRDVQRTVTKVLIVTVLCTERVPTGNYIGTWVGRSHPCTR